MPWGWEKFLRVQWSNVGRLRNFSRVAISLGSKSADGSLLNSPMRFVSES
ncbi:predicted protein [Sclerotinia sclerotiorum 1980 UF-70]|uniref:Uncharacterized protein n=1 Tax=Sclerotinia sclerotiorum (strain ATCC 18683 / 1980 / Ss-1) TaxID=665079 RepID=A7EH02_SCLS1|nr:predicted protein [Sclerotinia sclerotiorum 1980 UF-70]EDO02118.1 predicted protein [Sclerotinia sclerotiorum 1980 UF-70]